MRERSGAMCKAAVQCGACMYGEMQAFVAGDIILVGGVLRSIHHANILNQE